MTSDVNEFTSFPEVVYCMCEKAVNLMMNTKEPTK